MKYEVNITRQAEEDIRGIYRYIAIDLQSPQNAAGQIYRLEKSIYSLDYMPERFRAYEKEPWHSRNLRVMPVDNYIVFYVPDFTAGWVDIIRVIYGGRDIDRCLNEMFK